MKVLCLTAVFAGHWQSSSKRNGEVFQLSPGKVYDVIKVTKIPFSIHRESEPDLFYLIKCDTGEEKHFNENNFRELTISELRQLKLEELI